MSAPNQFSLSLDVSWMNNSTVNHGNVNAVDGAATTQVEPRPLDVLCGKSKRCVDHGGSRRFRSVIECYREKYQAALTKWDKTSVTRTIYDNLSQAGSRFLKYNEPLQTWEEISPMAARDKIGHALRFANRVSRKRRNYANCIGDNAAAAASPLPALSVNPHSRAALLQVLDNISPKNPPTAQMGEPSTAPVAHAQPLHSMGSSIEGTSKNPPTASMAETDCVVVQSQQLLNDLLEQSTVTTSPSHLVLGSISIPGTSCNPAQPLNSLQQMPPLGCVSAAVTAAPQHLVYSITPSPTPSCPVQPAAETNASANDSKKAASATSAQPLQNTKPGMLLSQSILPLGRSQQWYQTSKPQAENSIHKAAKPGASSSTSPTALSALLDDSFSILDCMNALNQPQQTLNTACQQATAQGPACPPPPSNKDDTPFDFDFDAEILSVLF